jgi:hypothetical protein
MTGSHSRSSTWITAPSSAICTALRLRKALLPPALIKRLAAGGWSMDVELFRPGRSSGPEAELLEHPLSSGGA